MQINQLHKFLIVSILPQEVSEAEAFGNISELISLIESYGGRVSDILLQKREVHEKGMYIGQGKVEEAGEIIRNQKIDVVVLNGIVKPGQIYELQTIWSKQNLKIEVWDRVDLILKIFSIRANTAEAKLQIEIAAMSHMGPRIYGMGLEMSRQGGGIGTRGIGETNTTLMKQHWRVQIKKAKEKLQKLSKDRDLQIARRQKIGLKTASIIGYTNAGKTSLFNTITKKTNLTKNELFVTLDSSVGKIYLPDLKQEILISDTIGFISDLPPQLIEAFKSTLSESLHSDLLIQVIDIRDPQMDNKIEVVEKILEDLNLNHKNRIYVFNKCDLKNTQNKNILKNNYSDFNPQFISTLTGSGIKELIETLDNYFQISSVNIN